MLVLTVLNNSQYILFCLLFKGIKPLCHHHLIIFNNQYIGWKNPLSSLLCSAYLKIYLQLMLLVLHHKRYSFNCSCVLTCISSDDDHQGY